MNENTTDMDNSIADNSGKRRRNSLSSESGNQPASECSNDSDDINASHKNAKRQKIVQNEPVKKNLTPEEFRDKMWAAIKEDIPNVQVIGLIRVEAVQAFHKKCANRCLKYFKLKTAVSEQYDTNLILRTKFLIEDVDTSYWEILDESEDIERWDEDQRNFEIIFMEFKRQQRRLNFFVTQTELYAYYMSKTVDYCPDNEHYKIVDQLDKDEFIYLFGTKPAYDCEKVKTEIYHNVLMACKADKSRCIQFGKSTNVSSSTTGHLSEPSMFAGKLKDYQLNGIFWLGNLYDQGMNGILADEMGLGKTIQSIAFLCHIAEKYSMWGPFLIISPLAALANWQRAIARFAPDFKVIHYIGNSQQRIILKQFWGLRVSHTRNSHFHVVVISYELLVIDFDYFNQIEWEYLILDKALESTESMAWRIFLNLKCRNRLLLSGTPIEENTTELWALLYFIMPSLFYLHTDFNKWISRDIEIINRIDTNLALRLYSVLKPFILRRIKKDVKYNFEITIMYCFLSSRQHLLYSALKEKMNVDDLSKSTDKIHSKIIAPNLLNTSTTQVKKIRNHPELLEKLEPVSPFFFNVQQPIIPKILYDHGIIDGVLPNKQHLLHNILNIFSAEFIHRSLFPLDSDSDNGFSVLKFLDLSPQELNAVFNGGISSRWSHIIKNRKRQIALQWSDNKITTNRIFHNLRKVPDWLIFTSHGEDEFVFSFGSETTIEHRVMRSLKRSTPLVELNISDVKHSYAFVGSSKIIKLLPKFPYKLRQPLVLESGSTFLREFMHQIDSHVKCFNIYPSYYSRTFSWFISDYKNCNSDIGYDSVLYGDPNISEIYKNRSQYLNLIDIGGLVKLIPINDWSGICMSNEKTFNTGFGKLLVLDGLLKQLKDGHRVLITCSQMTDILDILGEYMRFRNYKYVRLNESSNISYTASETFVFLTTETGRVGINLSFANTVIFYDDHWNPNGMDYVVQTERVTLYRLICQVTIGDRTLEWAREKTVISDNTLKRDGLEPTEVVSIVQRQMESGCGRGPENFGNRKRKSDNSSIYAQMENDVYEASSSEYIGLFDDEKDGNINQTYKLQESLSTNTVRICSDGHKRCRSILKNDVPKPELLPDISVVRNCDGSVGH